MNHKSFDISFENLENSFLLLLNREKTFGYLTYNSSTLEARGVHKQRLRLLLQLCGIKEYSRFVLSYNIRS